MRSLFDLLSLTETKGSNFRSIVCTWRKIRAWGAICFFSPLKNKDIDCLNCSNDFNIKFQRIKILKFSFLIYFLNKNTSFKQGNINIWTASSSKLIIPHCRQIWMYIYMYIYIIPLSHIHFHSSPFCSLSVQVWAKGIYFICFWSAFLLL